MRRNSLIIRLMLYNDIANETNLGKLLENAHDDGGADEDENKNVVTVELRPQLHIEGRLFGRRQLVKTIGLHEVFWPRPTWAPATCSFPGAARPLRLSWSVSYTSAASSRPWLQSLLGAQVMPTWGQRLDRSASWTSSSDAIKPQVHSRGPLLVKVYRDYFKATKRFAGINTNLLERPPLPRMLSQCARNEARSWGEALSLPIHHPARCVSLGLEPTRLTSRSQLPHETSARASSLPSEACVPLLEAGTSRGLTARLSRAQSALCAVPTCCISRHLREDTPFGKISCAWPLRVRSADVTRFLTWWHSPTSAAYASCEKNCCTSEMDDNIVAPLAFQKKKEGDRERESEKGCQMRERASKRA